MKKEEQKKRLKEYYWWDCPKCGDKSGFVSQGYGGRGGIRCQKCNLYLPNIHRKLEYKIMKFIYKHKDRIKYLHRFI